MLDIQLNMPMLPNRFGALSAESRRAIRAGREELQREQDGKGRLDARGGKELSPEEKQVVRRLQQRDAEVRAHESAHMAAGGDLVRGGARYTYQTGPDGRPYAVGGEVSLDSGKEVTPEATLAKAQRLKAAALAPASPSPQDYRVAAQAAMMAAEAATEMTAQASDLNTASNADASDTTTAGDEPAAMRGDEPAAMRGGEPAAMRGGRLMSRLQELYLARLEPQLPLFFRWA